MPHLSVKISDHLHQQIVEKGRQIGIDNISDIVRILLLWAVENNREGGASNIPLHPATNYSVMVYCLIEECILSMAESGPELIDKAHAKAGKLIADLLGK